MVLCRPLKRVLKKAIDTVVLLMVFVLVEKTESAKNICETVIGNMINLGFLIVDTSSKQQKIYFAKYVIIFTYLIIFHKSHLLWQVMAHVCLQIIFTAQKHMKYRISVHFKTPVTGAVFTKPPIFLRSLY